MSDDNISILMESDGDLYKQNTILDCNSSRDKSIKCPEFDTLFALSFKLKYFNDVVLNCQIYMYQDFKYISDDKVWFGKPYLDDIEDNEDEEKNFIIIEENKKEKEFSSISPCEWHKILLKLKKRIHEENDTQEICKVIFYLLYTEENFYQSYGVDFREITRNIMNHNEIEVDVDEDEDYKMAIEAGLDSMTLEELSNYYGGIEDHISDLCENYFSFIDKIGDDDAYFWNLDMDPLTAKEIINVMGYRRTKDISKVEKLFNLLKEKGVIKRFDEKYRKELLKEFNNTIKNSKNEEKIEQFKIKKNKLEKIII